MIEIITKILNYFGYEVVKSENWMQMIDDSLELECYRQWNLLHKGIINDCKVEYVVSNFFDTRKIAVVMKSTKHALPMMIIKAFPYSKDEDYEYTRMCAEELRDKLNENI